MEGSEKQIAWAITLRENLLNELETFLEEFSEKYADQKIPIFDRIMGEKSAKWFIDHRDDSLRRVVKNIVESIEKEPTNIIEKKEEKAVMEEATIAPQNPSEEGIVEIKIEENKVSLSYRKNQKFIDIVKSHGCRWDPPHWQKKINITTGTAEDRAAELGNKLLNAGFTIRILDENVRKKAVEGEFEPEHNRWVLMRIDGNYAGRLAIVWSEKNDRLYNAARALPESRWNSGVLVKVEYFKEIEEFAKLFDFKIGPTAKKAIEEYKESLQNIQKVNPVKVEEKEQKDGLEEILNSSTDIIPDLIDEE